MKIGEPAPWSQALGVLIFARMREGFAYDEIAAEEGVTADRIRQIVSETLQKRGVDAAPIAPSCNWRGSSG